MQRESGLEIRATHCSPLSGWNTIAEFNLKGGAQMGTVELSTQPDGAVDTDESGARAFLARHGNWIAGIVVLVALNKALFAVYRSLLYKTPSRPT